MPGEVDADADHRRHRILAGNALRENAGALGLADQHVVGPLEPQAGGARPAACLAIASTVATPASSDSCGDHRRRTGEL